MFGFFSILFLVVWCVLLAGVTAFSLQQGFRKKDGKPQPNVPMSVFLGVIALLMLVTMLPGLVTTSNIYRRQKLTAAGTLAPEIKDSMVEMSTFSNTSTASL